MDYYGWGQGELNYFQEQSSSDTDTENALMEEGFEDQQGNDLKPYVTDPTFETKAELDEFMASVDTRPLHYAGGSFLFEQNSVLYNFFQ